MESSKVVHNYHDHSWEVEEVGETTGSNSSQQNFPAKLHYMLGELEAEGLDHIVSWMPHGRCFVVHKLKEFIELILPKWFRQTKFASFQRQLNLYGFKRISSGRDKGGYYHELFLRGKRFLCHRINRHKVKGQGARKASSPESEPNFYTMPYLPAEKSITATNLAGLLANSRPIAAIPGGVSTNLLGSIDPLTLRQLQAAAVANVSTNQLVSNNVAAQLLQASQLGNLARLTAPQYIAGIPGLTLGSPAAAPNLLAGVLPQANPQGLLSAEQQLQALLAMSNLKPKASDDASSNGVGL